MAYIPAESGGSSQDIIDMSIFDDYEHFTQPTIAKNASNVDRLTSLTGGYKQVGKNVYVRLTCTLNQTAFDTSVSSMGNFTLLSNMPEPAYWTPVLTGGYNLKTVMSGLIMRNSAGNPGFFTVTLKQDEILLNSSRIYVQGIYRTA